jgi:hypothetical protein
VTGELAAVMVARAVVDRHHRWHLCERLAETHGRLLTGLRLDHGAEELTDIALEALHAADLCAPCADRPDTREALAWPTPVRWPSQPSRPVVRSRRDQLKDRAERLVDVGALDIERHGARLEILETCDASVLDRWEVRLLALEVEHLDTGRPFEPAGDRAAA